MKTSPIIRALGAVASLVLQQQPGVLLMPLAALKPQTAFAADPHAGHAHAVPAPDSPTVAAAASAPKAKGKPVYQCPMHPQIVRDHPDTCPICYMDLEKVDLDQSDAPAPAQDGVKGKAPFRLSAERSS
jgi:Cu(I)/Ag(I) efflux system membrane fusion protein